MVKILVPKRIEDKFGNFEHSWYEKINEQMYSNFWDIVIVENLDDAKVALQFKKVGMYVLNVGEDRIEGSLKIDLNVIEPFLDLLIHFIEQKKELENLKKDQDLLFEPLNLNPKMALAYRKLSRIFHSRVSIVVAQDGLLEDWILSKSIGKHEIIDFLVIQEEEALLRLFGSKNHFPLFLDDTKIVLMNCDLSSQSAISKISIASSGGTFSSYNTNDDKACRARIIFHFRKIENIPPTLIQIAGKHIVEIPTLKDINEDLPTIFRFTISVLGQKRKNLDFKLSDDMLENLKKFEWKENWAEFFRFCNSFLAGEVKMKNDLSKAEVLPPMKDYLKMIISEEERQFLKRAIQIYGMDKQKICEALKINYKTLSKKLKLYGLDDKK